MREEFRDNNVFTGEVVARLCAHPQHASLRKFIAVSSGLPGGTELGNAYAAMLLIRHHLAPQPYFRINDELVALLEATELGDDVPMNALQLPFPRCFIEFGSDRKLDTRLPNVETGLHILEGAYCEQGSHAEYGPGLYVLLTGSPLGKAHAVDDATHAVFLPTGGPGQSLRQALQWSADMARQHALQEGLRVSPPEALQHTLESLLLWAKVVLYLGLSEARKTLHAERSTLLKAVADKKSPGKRAKLERRARMLVDYIEVSAPPSTLQADTGSAPQVAESRPLRAHWRRGHYRMQPHGPRFSQSKLIFIRPTLIHGQGAPAPAGQYRVS